MHKAEVLMTLSHAHPNPRIDHRVINPTSYFLRILTYRMWALHVVLYGKTQDCKQEVPPVKRQVSVYSPAATGIHGSLSYSPWCFHSYAP